MDDRVRPMGAVMDRPVMDRDVMDRAVMHDMRGPAWRRRLSGRGSRAEDRHREG